MPLTFVRHTIETASLRCWQSAAGQPSPSPLAGRDGATEAVHRGGDSGMRALSGHVTDLPRPAESHLAEAERAGSRRRSDDVSAIYSVLQCGWMAERGAGLTDQLLPVGLAA
jgi:hypothetical protein